MVWNSNCLQLISTLSFTFPAISEDKVPRVDAWLRSVLWEHQLPSSSSSSSSSSFPNPAFNFEIHRVKGILRTTNSKTRIIQGVREMFEITDPESRAFSDEGDVPGSKIVLIGKGLGRDGALWRESLLACLGDGESGPLRG